MALGSYPCWSYHRPPPCTPCSSSLGAVAWPQAKLRTLDTLDPSDSLPSTLVTFVTTASFLALPPHCARSRRSSKTTGATTRSRSLAFPVTAYGASHRGAGPSSSPFAVTFTLKMPVALPYPRMLSMLLGSISPNVFPHGALSCTPVAHTLAHRPPPLRALLILFWRGCLAAGQASYTRHLVSLRRILPCPSPQLRTEQAIFEDHR